ncbi:MAG: helix-turn-helix transcriptional regulator [Gemmatimonadota bacterium]
MTTQEWTERFYGTTRGRIVRLLRRTDRTVSDLAEALELTDNAVRGHLAVLERDGWIERSGVRRGLGKPAQLYRLTAEAGHAFSRAYAPVLQVLLTVLEERLEPAELDAVLEEVGTRAAAGAGVADSEAAGFDERLGAAVGLIEALGGDVEIHRNGGPVKLEGHGCPLSELAEQHEKACRVVRSLLAEVVGRPVRQCCDRVPPTRCRFEIEPPGPGG